MAGAEKSLLDLLPELKKYHISCELMCITPERNTDVLEDYCMRMREKGVKASLLRSTSRLSFIKTARSIANYLKQNQIQIIHSHLFNSDLLAVLVKILFVKEVLLLSTKHGYEEEYMIRYGEGNKKLPYFNLYHEVSRFIIKRIDHNITVSKALSEMYSTLRLGKSNMPFIHHGINLQPAGGEALKVEGYPKIMTVGRLKRVKGHRYLIKALPLVIDKFPNLKLLILGEGELKVSLQEQALKLGVSDNIIFLGFTNPQLYSSDCKLMILPSLYESFGLVYIESFALKIPVVAFDVEAGNEIIENNQTGILVTKRSCSALAENIIHLLKSPGERERIAKNAYNKYLTYYNVERMTKEIADWYHSILVFKDQ